LLAKNVKVSFSSGSTIEILDELEEIASRPSQTPPHWLIYICSIINVVIYYICNKILFPNFILN